MPYQILTIYVTPRGFDSCKCCVSGWGFDRIDQFLSMVICHASEIDLCIHKAGKLAVDGFHPWVPSIGCHEVDIGFPGYGTLQSRILQSKGINSIGLLFDGFSHCQLYLQRLGVGLPAAGEF